MKKSCPTKISKKFSRVNLGFTLIELLITISIIGILSAIGLARYNQFNRRQILVQAAQELKSNLRLVQSKALGAEKPTGCDTLSGHKLKFLADNKDYKIVAVCGGGEIDVKTGLALGSNVTKSGPSSVFFKVLAQGVEEETTFTLSALGAGDPIDVVVTVTGEIK